MDLKKKVIGILAATGLTMSLFAGAVSADTGDEVPVRAQVNAGFCSVSIAESNMDFGTWTYEGGEWVNPGSTYKDVHVSVGAALPNGDCDIAFSMNDGLIGQNDSFSASANVIEQSNLKINFYHSLDFNETNLPATVPNVGEGGSYQGSLNVTIPDDAKPDTYVGTLKAEASNGA